MSGEARFVVRRSLVGAWEEWDVAIPIDEIEGLDTKQVKELVVDKLQYPGIAGYHLADFGFEFGCCEEVVWMDKPYGKHVGDGS